MELQKNRSNLINEEDIIYDIVKQYPQLKEVLIHLSPKFIKLSNPLLLNTVARYTTVKKAAEIGRIYLTEMLYQLNEAIGKSEEFLATKKKNMTQMKNDFLTKPLKKYENIQLPDWYSQKNNFSVIDVRHDEQDPFLKITNAAKTTNKGDGLILIQKFEPLPLIHYLSKNGFEYYTEKINDTEYKVYFYKK